jgi:outer membrane protein TolC
MSELSVDVLVQQVLARNPSLTQMLAAWQAAAARYPQVTSLEDPMFGAVLGPASIGSNKVDFAYRLEAAQRLPFPGKLSLRGQTALAEAAAAGHDVDDTRLQLIESARTAFFDYYLVYHVLAVNEENLQLLRDFRQVAAERFRTAQAPQQDILQADVEIGRQRERGLTLERMRKVAIARLNTLLHLPPDCPVPPPPKELKRADRLPSVAELRQQALGRRPDLQALHHRLAAEEAALALAYKEYCPDLEIMAAYDAFWQPEERDLRPMVGLRLNMALPNSRRQGAVAEAVARIAQRRAELASRSDQVQFQVQEAYEQVLESEQAVRLYEETVLPAARENVKAAQAAYAVGRIPFLSLIEAQRNAVLLRDRFYELQADYFRRRATLERVSGASLTPPDLPPVGK